MAKDTSSSRRGEAVPGVLNMRDLASLPDVEWLIPNLLMRRGLSVLHGQPGSLKSFVALHIAGCVAYGLPFLPDGPATQRGLVLYIAFEGITAFKSRRRAWLRYQKKSEPDYDALKLINPRKEQAGDLDGIDFDINDPAKVGKFVNIAQEIAKAERLPIGLVVIDVLKEALKDGIESVRTFREAAIYARLIANTLATHVMILHHNKSKSENMRGPGSLEGAIETRLALFREGMQLALYVAKNREGDSGYTVGLKAHKITLAANRDEQAVSSLALEVVGVMEDAEDDANTSRAVQIANHMEVGTSCIIATLIRDLGWSKDGRGGKQRQWVKDALRAATASNPRIVHLGKDGYRKLWLAMVDGKEQVHCDVFIAPKMGTGGKGYQPEQDVADEGTPVPPKRKRGKWGTRRKAKEQKSNDVTPVR